MTKRPKNVIGTNPGGKLVKKNSKTRQEKIRKILTAGSQNDKGKKRK